MRMENEVFTSSWICNAQNNLIDNAWLKQENSFNTENGKNWTASAAKVSFKNSGKTWRDYVQDKRLEISCGEAPYLVSRYDVVSGEKIEMKNRIGILDRKIRIVNENAAEDEWLEWVKRAFQSTYGYELQEKNLVVARKNLLCTFCDYYFEKHGEQPSSEMQGEITKIISRNIWKMDGLNGVVPSEKFGAIVGNPPYQSFDGGGGSSAIPLYNKFVEIGKAMTPDFLTMIIPSRWMTGGKGLSKFRKAMLADRRIVILHDFMNSRECFPNVQIEGGVCYFLWDKNAEKKCKIYTHRAGAIIKSNRYLSGEEIFVRDGIALQILNAVKVPGESFNKIVSQRNLYGIDKNKWERAFAHFKEGTLKILGKKREIKYINKSQIKKGVDAFDKYKLYVSKADGAAGQIGHPVPARIIGKVELGEPESVCSETFLRVGPFESKREALNCQKYMQTKFFRFLVGIRKNKNMPRDAYKFAPLQNFSNNGDIDWSKSIAKIDEQLYKKYNIASQSDYIEETII
ncbi:MAG: Eco57I restriction-modification methylase domain-containing protein [Fibromonadales bacterium]|nr:Eco57I restriction-modification methylase domain-containing protein [Fibromonadales bacterium]